MLAALMFALGVALAACGGSEDSDEGGSGGFLADADAICIDSARESIRIFSEASPITGPEEGRAYLEELQPARQATVDELGALDAPEELAAGYDEFLLERQGSVDQINEGIAATQEGTEEDFAAAQKEAERISEKGEAAAAEVGLEACARTLTPEAEEMARENITEAATSNDPAVVCDELATEQLLENQFGGREACEEAQADATMADSAELADLKGIAEVEAGATVTIVGGESDGESFDVTAVFEDGAYKIDTIAPAEGV